MGELIKEIDLGNQWQISSWNLPETNFFSFFFGNFTTKIFVYKIIYLVSYVSKFTTKKLNKILFLTTQIHT